MDEAAADETSVPEEPEPVPEETAYPVCIHVATEDGEELLEVTVPEGSSVAAALDGGVLLAAAEPELLFVPPHPASTSAAASTSAVRRLCFMGVLLYSQS